MSIRIFGASVIGPLHVQKNLPCQDAWAFSAALSGTGVIAVADGLGSASKSEVGARLAVDTAVASVKEAFAIADSVAPLDQIGLAAVKHAREALEKRSSEEECSLKDLACTMIVAALSQGCLAVAHIGDGAVVAQTADGLLLISGPGESEYANEVVPLTAIDWQESLRIVDGISGVRSLAVFTDGCQRAAFRKHEETFEPFEGFFRPIFSYAHELTDIAEGEKEIQALLSSKKICENSEDDKTLAIAVMN